MFSTSTSAVLTSARKAAWASGSFRSSAMHRLLRCRLTKSNPSRAPPKPSLLPGGSTRMMSAPQSARWRTHVGPARASVRSSTRRPVSGSGSTGGSFGVARFSDTGILLSPRKWVRRRGLACGSAGSRARTRRAPAMIAATRASRLVGAHRRPSLRDAEVRAQHCQELALGQLAGDRAREGAGGGRDQRVRLELRDALGPHLDGPHRR